MSDIDAVYLPETTEAYLEWAKSHPEGYVIAGYKSGVWEMYWHRADCYSILSSNASYIGSDNFKACASDPGFLAVWAKSQPWELGYCKHCQNKYTAR